MRNDTSGEDEFKTCKASFHLYEAQFDGMRYILDPIHRDKFPYKDEIKFSQTDRVCHDSDKNLKIEEYKVVVNRGTKDKASGAGSDHKAVFETFEIIHSIDGLQKNDR